MSNRYILGAILVAAACTLLMRALPFLFMGGEKKVPEKIRYLGRILPAAMMSVLIVYCLKSVPEDFSGQGICQLIAVGVCAVLHIWKKNTLLSIVASTCVYMLLCAVGFA